MNIEFKLKTKIPIRAYLYLVCFNKKIAGRSFNASSE